MINKILFFLGVLFFFSAPLCSDGQPDPRSWEVLVSILPHKYFVERISEDLLKVRVLIPSSANAHTYEPSPRQVLFASNADIWFRIGEPIENRALAALQSHNSRLTTVDLRKGLDLISSHSTHSFGHTCSGGEDLHFWLSPIQAKIQAKTIADELSKQYPEHTDSFNKNLNSFLKDLDHLHQGLIEKLSPLRQRTIVVSHPAYSYFCRDYRLSQISIEFEGKDPSPRQLTRVLTKIRELKIHKIFIQPQFQNKGAILVAKEVGAKLITFDPYSENYLEMMRTLGNFIAGN